MNDLVWLKSLTRATPQDKKRIERLHFEAFGNSIDICINCPDSLRAGVKRLIKRLEWEK